MKTNRIKKLARLAGAAVAIAMIAGSVSILTAEEIPTGKGGATKLMQLNNRLVTPRGEPSRLQPMSCPKCRDTTVTVKNNEPTKGAGARALLAGGTPTKLIARHECKGCGVEWKTTGHGKAKVSLAIHKCASCGAENLACCNTTKGGEVATKGMEKKFDVAPLK